jgi:CheY-specific phosphatase CheX
MPLPERDLSYFIDVTLAHLNKLAGNELELRDPTLEFQALVFSSCTGLIHLKGGVEGFIYVTASHHFLQHLSHFNRGRFSDDNAREVMTDLANTIAHNVHKRFGPALNVSEPRIFNTVPDDPIEMPPAVFVLPLNLHTEHAFFVLGIAHSPLA